MRTRQPDTQSLVIGGDAAGYTISWRLADPDRAFGGLIVGGTRADRARLTTSIAKYTEGLGLASVTVGDPSGHIGCTCYGDTVWENEDIASLNNALTARQADPTARKRLLKSSGVPGTMLWHQLLIVEDLHKVLAHHQAGPGLQQLIRGGGDHGVEVLALAAAVPVPDPIRSLTRRNAVHLDPQRPADLTGLGGRIADFQPGRAHWLDPEHGWRPFTRN